MPRIARVVAPDYPHHVTQRGNNRMNVFLDDEDRRYFLKCMKEWTDRTVTRVWAYCLMDNHFHLLLVPVTEDGLGKCLHGVTFTYAQYFNRKYKRSGRLWQNRYFSCPVDKDKYLWAAAGYIERNPVRANTVKKAEDWEWSSAGAHIEEKNSDIAGLSDWLEGDRKDEYRRFIESDGREDEIRRATSTGRPFGDMRFVGRMEEMTRRGLRPRKGGRPRKVR